MLAAPVFFDLILSDLDDTPRPGTEVRAGALAVSPGGSATLAVAASRLGLRTALVTTIGDDLHGRWCWEFLANEGGIDLEASRKVSGWQTPVTVSVATNGDRSMITRGDASPVPLDELVDGFVEGGKSARAALVDLSGGSSATAWWPRVAATGTRIFADAGWDSTGRWDPADLDPLTSCYAFTPNDVEAMAYTRTTSPAAAARALTELVPLIVVTCGAQGAHAIDAASSAEVAIPAVPADVCDATGAGDVFRAALLLGTLRDWPLEQRLAFAVLCAALAVERLGGARAAPAWRDVAGWWARNRASGDRELVGRYEFLTDVLGDASARRPPDASNAPAT